MQDTTQQRALGLPERGLIGGIVLVVLIFLGVSMSHAAELVPSIGVSRGVDGGASHFTTGLALRTSMIPFVKGELGFQYRQDKLYNGAVNSTTWPVTASVWFAPIPFAYAGGGAGWYQSTLSMPGQTLLASETQRTFGTHVGGGLSMPLAPMIGLDLNGRYVVLKERKSSLFATPYDPSFWSASLGLAVKF
jgi:hypothetical protein